jgi:hypothetical protein
MPRVPDGSRSSQRRWRDERDELNRNRHGLAHVAAALHSGSDVGERCLLARPEWVPTVPVPLERVELTRERRWLGCAVDGTEPASAAVRALQADGRRFPTYAATMAALAPPAVFENRPTYRLVDVTVTDETARLTFAIGHYFDLVNVGEAVAHELSVAKRRGPVGWDELPFRRLIGDPLDLLRRSVSPAISVLTLRRSSDGRATFVLHWRDHTKVAHAGGLYQVMPVGVFQPSAPGAANEDHDFDLWRSIVREYSEELVGEPERHGDPEPIDYAAWPFARAFDEARRAGRIRGWFLGLGIDPLSLVADLLAVVVIDAEVFDELFRDLGDANDEGRIDRGGAAGSGSVGFPFEGPVIEELVDARPLQAAGSTLLLRAWAHRSTFLRPAKSDGPSEKW